MFDTRYGIGFRRYGGGRSEYGRFRRSAGNTAGFGKYYLGKPSEGSPSSYDAKQNLFIAAGELQRSGGFVGESYGSTTSAGITQEVLNKRTVVGGNVFKQMSTCSSLVKNAYQVYLYGDSYLYRKANKIKDINAIEWDSTAQNFGKEGF